MKEKTLRYPGHIEKIATLRETGFFDKNKIAVNEAKIRPLDIKKRYKLSEFELWLGLWLKITPFLTEINGWIKYADLYLIDIK